MNRHELKDSCCHLLDTFKVKELTIYFKGYRIYSLLDQGGYSEKLFTLVGRRAQERGMPVLGLSCSISSFLSTKEFFNLDCTWGAMLTATSLGSEI